MAIYEASNPALKEVYIGATERLLDQLQDAFHADPPPIVSHWGKSTVVFRFVEYSLSARKVKDFIASQAEKAAVDGWKVLVDP